MLRAIHTQEDSTVVWQKAGDIAKKLEKMRLRKAASIVCDGIEETFSCMNFPQKLEANQDKQSSGADHAGYQEKNKSY